MGPYFVQVGALHSYPFIIIWTLLFDSVRVRSFTLYVMIYRPLLCTSRGLTSLPFISICSLLFDLVQVRPFIFVCHALQALTLYKSGPYILPYNYYIHFISDFVKVRLFTFVCHILQAPTLYKSGPYILTMFLLYALCYLTCTNQIIHTLHVMLTGPYFVQVGALFSLPISRILSYDFRQIIIYRFSFIWIVQVRSSNCMSCI